MPRFLSIAHRGASGQFPENTRLAFEKALETHADMIELDCQLSGDGHVVVFHDETLWRTAARRGAVREQTLERLQQLEIGGWRKRSFSGQRILKLEEALEIVAGRADLCVDIKLFPRSPSGIELKLLFILSHYDYLERTIFSSFDYRSLGRVRELAPESRIGLTYSRGVREDPFVAAEQLGAASIHLDKRAATSEFLKHAWEKGLDVYVWTVNRPSEIERFASLGVQGIFSDFPERLWRQRHF